MSAATAALAPFDFPATTDSGRPFLRLCGASSTGGKPSYSLPEMKESTVTEITLTIRVAHYDGPGHYDPHVLADSLIEKIHPEAVDEPFTFGIVDDEKTTYAVVSADLVTMREV